MDDIFKLDKRSNIRIQDRLSVVIWYKERNKREESETTARGIDISEKGIKVVTDIILPKISSVDLEILFPTPYLPVKTKGKIIWRNDDKLQYGIQFGKINKDFLQLISNYVNRPTITRKLKVMVNRPRSKS